jgi:hypothetical protein
LIVSLDAPEESSASVERRAVSSGGEVLAESLEESEDTLDLSVKAEGVTKALDVGEGKDITGINGAGPGTPPGGGGAAMRVGGTQGK